MAQYDVKFTNNYDAVNNPNGLHPIVIQEESINTQTDIALFGRKRLSYGRDMNQNMLSLLEKFACPENPLIPGTPDLSKSGGKLTNPIMGQMWYNETQKIPFMWDGTTWVSLLSHGSIASNWGIISNGQQLPQPVGDDGYTFTYNECVWIVGPFSIDGEIFDYTIETDSNGVVTATYNSGQPLVVNYLIVGIKGNTNEGTLNPVITPTPTPTVSRTPSSTPMPVNLASGLVSFWEFEDSAISSDFIDCVGTNNFQRQGSTPISEVGKVNLCIKGTETTFLNANSPVVGSNNYTFGGWFKLNSNFTGYSNLFQRGTFGELGQRSFTLTYTLGTDSLSLYKSNDGTAYEYVNTSPNLGLDDFNWHFIVGWVDTATMTLNIQVDNGAIYSSPFIFPQTFNIGTFKLGSSTGIPMQTAVDQLFYYNRVLNSAERAAMYNNGNGVTCASASGQITPTPTPTRTPTPSITPTPNIVELTASILGSYSVYGECNRSGVGQCSAITDTVYVVATGGSGSYAYQWVHVSGYGDSASPFVNTDVNSPNSSSTNFTRTADAQYYDGVNPTTPLVGNYRCVVTDTVYGGSVQSPVIMVSTRHQFVPLPLSLTLSPPSGVSGICNSGFPDSSHSCQATSGIATALPSGGSGNYTYSWTYVSGSPFDILNPTSNQTRFRYSQIAANQTLSAVFRCTVNDGFTSVAQDISVELEFANTQ